MKILAISPGYWGIGKTIEEAKSRLRGAGGNVKQCGLYAAPDDYYIDEMGNGHGSETATFIGGTDHRVDWAGESK